VGADLEDLHDVGVRQPGDGVALGQEAGPPARVAVAAGQDHLQRHHPAGGELPRLVDDPYPAPAEFH
jgi:hypothetical protein